MTTEADEEKGEPTGTGDAFDRRSQASIMRVAKVSSVACGLVVAVYDLSTLMILVFLILTKVHLSLKAKFVHNKCSLYNLNFLFRCRALYCALRIIQDFNLTIRVRFQGVDYSTILFPCKETFFMIRCIISCILYIYIYI